MKRPTKKEIEKGLKQLVEIRFLKEKDNKYNIHPNYKKTIMSCKEGIVESVLIEALWKAGYFEKPKSTREVMVVCNLLTLKKQI